jgi:hypothetical protein
MCQNKKNNVVLLLGGVRLVASPFKAAVQCSLIYLTDLGRD